MVPCPHDELLPKLLSGELTGTVVQELETHLDSCPRCQARVEQYLCQDPDAGRWRALMPPGGDDARKTTAQAQGGSVAAAFASVVPPASRYEIDRFLAKGNLGEVFVARDLELQREVALKQIQPQYAGLPEFRRRFLFESRLTGGLEHPGIVSVHGAGVGPEGVPFYTMQLIRGQSLKQAIAQLRADPSELGLRKLIQRFQAVCNAVAYAHSRRVLHRDIKPGNVMLGPFGETLLVDWGLAKLLGDDEASPQDSAPSPAANDDPLQTREGQVVGTPAYMSPEQSSGQLDQLSEASDIYSLGATLYELLTGTPPFSGSARQILPRVREGRFAPPREVDPRVPRPLEAICLRAMARAPGARYASALELASDIERWLADEPVSAYPDRLPARIFRQMRRNKIASIGLGLAAALALLLAAAGFGFRQREQHSARLILNDIEATLERAVQTADPLEQRRIMDEARRGTERLARHTFWMPSRLKDEALRAQEELTAADNDRRILAAFREFEDESARFSAAENRFQYDEAFATFRTRFLEYLPLEVETAETLIRRIQDRPAAIQRALLEILHTCLVELAKTDTEQADRVRTLLDQLDPEANRVAARLAVVRDDSERLIAFAEQLDPARHDPPFLLALAQSLANPERVSLLYRAVHDHPDRFWLRHELGNALYQQSRVHGWYATDLQRKTNLESAIMQFSAAAALRPGSAGSYLNLGRALHLLGRYDDALESYDQSIEQSPRFAEAHYNRGLTLFTMRQFQPALAAYEQALDCKPDYASAHYNQGLVLLQLGRVDEALECYRRSIEWDPDYAYGHNGIGVILHTRRDDRAGAIPHYRTSIECNRGLLESYNGLALALLELGKFAESLEVARAAMVAGPRDARFPVLAAGALLGLDQDERALAYAEVASRIDPRFALAQFACGESLLKQRHFGEAVEAYRQCLQLGGLPLPLRPHVRQQLAKALDAELERFATPEAQRGAELMRLAEMCRQQQHYRQAALLYAEAISAVPDAHLARHLYREKAARSAALAADGKGLDATPVSDADKQRLRMLAIEWLASEAESWKQRIRDSQPGRLVAAETALSGWLGNDDLARVRDTADLPDEPRIAVQKFWSDVAETLAEIRSRYEVTRDGGELRELVASNTHAIEAASGDTYVVDMTSESRNCFLHAVDPDERVLDVQTDLLPDQDHARIVFTAQRSGTIRLVAGTHQLTPPRRPASSEDTAGEYRLIVRRFRAN